MNDVGESWAQVALALALVERPAQKMPQGQAFARALTGYKFVPSDRILRAASVSGGGPQGAINLAKLVRDPFEAEAALDLSALAALTGTAMRMLDNAIEAYSFPLGAQKQEMLARRPVGLGVTGLADALIFCRARYGSDKSIALIQSWLSTLRHAACRASVALAREKGAFALFDRHQYLARAALHALPPDIRDGIALAGIRNATLTAIGPANALPQFTDNVSRGIAPVFHGYALRKFRVRFGRQAPLPGYFVADQAISAADHLAVQAACQLFSDNAIVMAIPDAADSRLHHGRA